MAKSVGAAGTMVQLARGRSPMDWQRLADRSDLAGERHKQVTSAMMRAHAHEWIILDGVHYLSLLTPTVLIL